MPPDRIRDAKVYVVGALAALMWMALVAARRRYRRQGEPGTAEEEHGRDPDRRSEVG
jgi:hypothetical protein